MAPKTWSLVQNVIHGRWSAEVLWASVREMETGTTIPPGLGISEWAVTVNHLQLDRWTLRDLGRTYHPSAAGQSPRRQTVKVKSRAKTVNRGGRIEGIWFQWVAWCIKHRDDIIRI